MERYLVRTDGECPGRWCDWEPDTSMSDKWLPQGSYAVIYRETGKNPVVLAHFTQNPLNSSLNRIIYEDIGDA